jgi:hypothetical protein
MSQQTQSDVFHTKMLQNALWCQFTWTEGIAAHFIFIHDFIIIGNVIECVLAVEWHIILKIWLILRI